MIDEARPAQAGRASAFSAGARGPVLDEAGKPDVRRRLTFSDAAADDAEALSKLHAETAAELTARFGHGPWSRPVVVRRIEAPSPFRRLRVGRLRGEIVTALCLATKKPWAIDVTHFTPVPRPLYLTDMATAVRYQRNGLGREALDDAMDVALGWPAQAIRLDAFDGGARAGAFYAACGYTTRARVVYKGTALVYYERVLSVPPGRSGAP